MVGYAIVLHVNTSYIYVDRLYILENKVLKYFRRCFIYDESSPLIPFESGSFGQQVFWFKNFRRIYDDTFEIFEPIEYIENIRFEHICIGIEQSGASTIFREWQLRVTKIINTFRYIICEKHNIIIISYLLLLSILYNILSATYFIFHRFSIYLCVYITLKNTFREEITSHSPSPLGVPLALQHDRDGALQSVFISDHLY